MEKIVLTSLEPLADDKCLPGVFQLFIETRPVSSGINPVNFFKRSNSTPSQQYLLVHLESSACVLRTPSLSLAIEHQRRANGLDNRLVQVAYENHTLEKLLQASIQRPDWRAVHLACWLCLPKYVEEVCSKGDALSLLNTATLSEGMQPIHIAASAGHVQLVQRLLLLGADPFKVDLNGLSTLHHLASSHHHQSAEILQLLRRGDVNAYTKAVPLQDEDGRTALVLALVKGNSAVVEAMLQYCGSGKQLESLFNGSNLGSCGSLDPHCLELVLAKEPGLMATEAFAWILHGIKHGISSIDWRLSSRNQ